MPSKQGLLSRLIGHLGVDSGSEPPERLQSLLARVHLPEDEEQVTAGSFSFEAADLFAPENLTAERSAAVERVMQEAGESEFRLFVREVPLRSTQLRASNPTWASGAAAELSLGPFLNLDGRRFWFDFFRIDKLVALYAQGVAEPALLFKLTSGIRFLDLIRPLTAEAQTSYRLGAGSIWINSRLLASAAPAGFFTGLAIRSGSITLSAAPTEFQGRLTIAPGTTARVKLQLAPQTVGDADPTSPYGQDARAAEVILPQEFAFHFAGGNHALDVVGDSAWAIYGHAAEFIWPQQQATTYEPLLNRVLIPLRASVERFAARDNRSSFHLLRGETRIAASFWALPAAAIDVANPSSAEGIGALLIRGEKGLTSQWTALRGGAVELRQPYVMAAPGRIAISDPLAGNARCQQDFKLWLDKMNIHGTTAQFQYLAAAPFFFNTTANGVELVSTHGNADVRADRPVTARGEPPEIRSRNSLLTIAATGAFRLIHLFDDNMLVDNLDATRPSALPEPLSLVLSNALFKTTQVNGCLLFCALAEDFVKVERASLFLTFGLHAYLPTLPDPYAANIDALKFQFRRATDRSLAVSKLPSVWMLLVCRVAWEPVTAEEDQAAVSFHFAPLPGQPAWAADGPAQNLDFTSLTGGQPDAGVVAQSHSAPDAGRWMAVRARPDYGAAWEKALVRLPRDQFALLDVSTHADLLGVSFGTFGADRVALLKTMAPASSAFPLQAQGMEVVSRGMNVRAFTVPQISWEPVINLTTPGPGIADPPAGPNYYPDDGGPTRLLNNSPDQVALAPLPLTDFLVESFAAKPNFATLSLCTLPFGLRALSLLQKDYFYEGQARPGAKFGFNAKTWASGVTGARQLQIEGGDPLRKGESAMFVGSTMQENNILDLNGAPTGTSTLGASVTEIFNNEFFFDPPQLVRQRGVPLTRMDLSGYGASIFSEWLNPKAAVAETSQAKFDVFVGRCAHEVIQVKTIMYPGAVKMVRTISLFRANSAYCYRYDSGWLPESDGLFDFTYYVYEPDGAGQLAPKRGKVNYSIHPGVCGGLFQVRNVRETSEIAPFTGTMKVKPGEFYVDGDGREWKNGTLSDMPFNYELQPVYFDADIEIEGAVSGFSTKLAGGRERKLVPAKRILGFVQIAPRGMVLTHDAFKELINRQGGTIGGAIDCVVDIGASGQQMRLGRCDFCNSFEADGVTPGFAVAGRGSVLLPKDGSWSVVKHEYATGQVSPVPPDLSTPLIRAGRLVKASDDAPPAVVDPRAELLRIADPAELLRAPANTTVNYGFLFTTETQKALFLTPAFEYGQPTLLSKTPPLFADAFRLVKSKAIFPNIGNAVTNFGDVISLGVKGTEFVASDRSDAGRTAFKIMQINDGAGVAKREGYKLLKNLAKPFDLPGAPLELINLTGVLRIYLEYKADKIQGPKDPDQPGTPAPVHDATGALDFDVNSFAANAADQWKSRMSDVAVVVDLGPIPRLMTIKGHWDSRKGAAAKYGGSATDANFPSPQIEFAGALDPAIKILQILQDLQGLSYKDAFARGLKLAMSNKAGSWEYKFEASKEIPVLKFPPPPFDNDPNTPLKLEAGLRLGAYFNSALAVSGDPKDLLPTAGAFLGFYGRLSVMCVSLSIATVYAVGQVTLDIAADSRVGPTLRMKFGFGAQVVIGLPVVGNVSVLYMVGVEIYTDATKLNISAFLLFQGHAELLAGLVSVTITIEAKGSINRDINPALPGGGRTDLEAQVTFGLDISIFLVINISFSTSWSEQRQIA